MTIEDLVAQHATLVAYLKSKVAIAEWHGCADAAMDLREIEAQLAVLREFEKQGHRRCSDAEAEAISDKWASRLG